MQGESLPQFPFAKRGRMSRFAKGCIALSDAEGFENGLLYLADIILTQ